MHNKTFQFDFKELNLSVGQIQRLIGYNENDDSEYLVSVIEEIMTESAERSVIKGQYTVFDRINFDHIRKLIGVENEIFNVGSIVFNQIKKASSVAFFLCTAGESTGLKSRKCMQDRDYLRGYIYDVVGSEIAEAAADLLQADLEKTASQNNLRLTNRYSPGYCGWNVSEQHKLFSLMPDNYCGIKLTETSLMLPEKSVSGIIGLGEDVKFNPYTCSICDMKNCIYRKLKEKK